MLKHYFDINVHFRTVSTKKDSPNLIQEQLNNEKDAILKGQAEVWLWLKLVLTFTKYIISYS